jgi:hypothetical protein
MSKFKEVVNNEERIYIHNDLANSVFHAKENVLRVKKLKLGFLVEEYILVKYRKHKKLFNKDKKQLVCSFVANFNQLFFAC